MSVNEHTGDKMKSKVSTDAYRDNWDQIFGKAVPKKEGTTICKVCHHPPSGCYCYIKQEPSSLDAAYQRKAIDDGFVFSEQALFPENRKYYANHPSRSYTKP